MINLLGQLTHTTVITGNRHKNLELVKDFLHTQGIESHGNPDIFIFDQQQLLIDDARTISTLSSTKKVFTKRFFIISCDRVASEVQNTLLKTIEEPLPETFFIFLLPTTDHLIPTVFSRANIIEGDQTKILSRLEVAVFLEKNISDRFEYIESWTKNKKDEQNVSKVEITSFVDQLENYLWNMFKNKSTITFLTVDKIEQIFADIRLVRNYIEIRGASHRILLDFIAMRCPILK